MVPPGSVRGRQHADSGANNQDAFWWTRTGDGVVAVLADGCGSSPRSEVGAELGVRLFGAGLVRALGSGALREPSELLESASRGMLGRLEVLAEAAGDRPEKAVHDLFLFTLVGAVLAPPIAFAFVYGDGVVVIDGEAHRLHAPGDAPDYPGYALLTGIQPVPFVWQLSPEIRSLVLGTDGAAELLVPGAPFALEELVDDEVLFRNPFALGRRLALAARDRVRRRAGGELSRERGRLADDTTVVVIRRRSPS